jgi:hypothetical protein
MKYLFICFSLVAQLGFSQTKVYSKNCGLPGLPACPTESELKVESYKGCHFEADGYDVLNYTNPGRAKCLGAPDLCQAMLMCDGSDPDVPYGNAKVTCYMVNGECPSLKDCVEDRSLDNKKINFSEYEKAGSMAAPK